MVGFGGDGHGGTAIGGNLSLIHICVYDKDPRLYPDAMKFDWISYEKMRRLIAGGAQVLHDRSVELAQRFGLAIEVLSSFTGQPGTIVCAEESGT